MLLFHGTVEPFIEGIFAYGLLPPNRNDRSSGWTKALSGLGQNACVFASTSPVASRGGNPVAFAMSYRGPLPERAGYIVVIDLPPEDLHQIRAVIPNVELHSFIDTLNARYFLQQPFQIRYQRFNERFDIAQFCIFYWLTQYLKQSAYPLEAPALRELLRQHIDESNSPYAWRITGIETLSTGRVNLRTEPEPPYSYVFKGFERYKPFLHFLQEKRPHSLPQDAVLKPYRISGAEESVLNNLAFLLRIVAAHVAPFAQRDILRFFHTHSSWNWDDWYAAFPAQECDLPRLWHPDYGRHFAMQDLKNADNQLILSSLPPRYILGAIKVSDGVKLLPHLRPDRKKGEKLSSRLWQRAYALRAQYSGKPLIIAS